MKNALPLENLVIITIQKLRYVLYINFVKKTVYIQLTLFIDLIYSKLSFFILNGKKIVGVL